MKKIFFGLTLLFLFQTVTAQRIITVADTVSASFRGLCVVNNQIVWVSGSNGTVGKSLDGGKSWKWITIKGFEKSDFRDIEAFDKKTALVMAVGEPGYILKTKDGGETWNVVFKDETPGIFFDAMEFWNDQSGIVIGDPINNRFFIARTFNGGDSWRTIPETYKPLADSGEACFAASGTNIRKLNKSEAVFVSGGLSSNIFIRDKKIPLPIQHGTASTGANSIAVKNKKIMIVVGGDYQKKDKTEKNCAITNDGGLSWHLPEVAPSGYRSCIEYLGENNWITAGLNGTDISENDGMNWRNISRESYHVCRKAKKGNAVYFAGNGRVGKLEE